jgi:hypothetical protein
MTLRGYVRIRPVYVLLPLGLCGVRWQDDWLLSLNAE